MKIRMFAASVLALTLAVFAAACNNDSSTSASTVSSVVVAGAIPTVGTTSQFSATANLSSGTSQDVTSVSTWSSSNTSAAIVSATGLVTAVGSGSSVITATYSNVVGSDNITVP